MDLESARTALIAQHDKIRMHLSECSELAQQLRTGHSVDVELSAALAQLRSELTEHNTAEADLICPLLDNSPGWGTLLVDRMWEAHLAEHAALWEMLVGSTSEVAARMDDLVDDLDAHMAAEERTFLSPLVLRHDVITRHRRQEPT